MQQYESTILIQLGLKLKSIDNIVETSQKKKKNRRGSNDIQKSREIKGPL